MWGILNSIEHGRHEAKEEDDVSLGASHTRQGHDFGERPS
jgi:hypothetical protein